jgi:hypothetical protein
MLSASVHNLAISSTTLEKEREESSWQLCIKKYCYMLMEQNKYDMIWSHKEEIIIKVQCN